MLTKNTIKYINSLRIKKYRDIYKQFIIEGDKLVDEFLHSTWEITDVYATKKWIDTLSLVLKEKTNQLSEIKKDELKKISSLKSPHNVLAIVKKSSFILDYEELSNGLSLVLDDVRDPGNLGTIVRIAAWFGIRNIICSPDTVDVFNPKVIQASMGAILQVKVFYCDLVNFLKEFIRFKVPVYGTFLDGKSVYDLPLSPAGLILMGNEAQGLSEKYFPYITEKLFIPGYPGEKKGIDSLNVSVATAIICSEFRRRKP